jgi:hypothetical protein
MTNALIHTKNNRRASRAMVLFAIVVTLLLLVAAMPRAVQAQGLPLPTTPTLFVTPAVGAAGEARALTVSGQWPNSCAPVAATLDTSVAATTKMLIVRLQAPLTLAPCAQVLTRYRFELAYTPNEDGVLRVRLVSSTGSPTGEGRIVTAVAGTTRAAGDITGIWYDPTTNGSGLSFTHAYQGSDAVFGTWYLYDRDGTPRWLSIQGVKWSSGGLVMEGTLYRTFSGADVCGQTLIACPASSAPAVQIGRVKASFIGIDIGNDIAPQATIEAFDNNNVPLFSSKIFRLF